MTTCLVLLKNDWCFYNCTNSALFTMSKSFCSHDCNLRMKMWQNQRFIHKVLFKISLTNWLSYIAIVLEGDCKKYFTYLDQKCNFGAQYWQYYAILPILHVNNAPANLNYQFSTMQYYGLLQSTIEVTRSRK